MRTSSVVSLLLAAILPITTAFPSLSPRETAPNSTCPAQQTQLETCVASYQPQVDLCTNSNAGPVDYCCLCSVYTEKLSCFDICPSSLDKVDVQDQLDAYCAAAADPCQAECLNGFLGLLAQCKGEEDSACMCTAYSETLTCYEGCPSSPPNPDAEESRDQFCAKASASSAVPTSTAVSACAAPKATVTATTYYA
ncbi:Nn.00g066740.m01.CDS01 [Neocucurbitaria sp. VM-36]